MNQSKNMQKIIKTLLRVDNHKILMKKKTKTSPDPFARPVKNILTEENQSSEVEEDGE